ncbi:MAG: putative dsRNA-binding protein [Clostridium sp.]|nr:MAG: putative dsRNA-binding protein [Clostridium sp.]
MSDYKSYLQELVQTDKKSLTYNVVKETGPAHDKTFEVEVEVDGIIYAHGVGKSKKEAEQNAAKNAIMISAGEVNETDKN